MEYIKQEGKKASDKRIQPSLDPQVRIKEKKARKMMAVGTILFVLLLALLILFFLRQLWIQRHLPPGPLALPLIGTLWAYGLWFREDYFRKPVKRYGNIYTISAGPYHLVVLSGFKTVKEVMTSFPEVFSDRSEDAFMIAVGKKR
ncbi:Cyp2j5: Cytochrome protein, partial [Crotalus adamanteus]